MCQNQISAFFRVCAYRGPQTMAGTACVVQCVNIWSLYLDIQTHAFIFGKATLLFEAYFVVFDPPQYNWSRKASHFGNTSQYRSTSSFIRKELWARVPTGWNCVPTTIWSLEQHIPCHLEALAKTLENVIPCILSVDWQQLLISVETGAENTLCLSLVSLFIFLVHQLGNTCGWEVL